MARDVSRVHPDLQAVARRLPRIPLNRWTVRLVRRLLRLLPRGNVSAGVEIQELVARSAGSQRGVRLRLLKPRASVTPAPLLLWMHGGGYVVGKPEMDDGYLATFVEELGIAVISVDYRLAPDNPFPAAIEDCYAALQWVGDHAEGLGVDRRRIAVGGLSAGGGLAASLAQMAHDRGEIEVLFQLLVYPMLDDRSALRPEGANPKFLVLGPDDVRFGWESYLQQAAGLGSAPAYAVPARRKGMAGLPPAWIGVGALDLFCAESVAYGNQLKGAGVRCDLLVVDGAFHAFDVFAEKAPVVQAFRQAQVEALRRRLCGEEV